MNSQLQLSQNPVSPELNPKTCEQHRKVSSARIKTLVRTATELTNNRNHIAASLLLWSAYEALLHRACVKALWLRGWKVTDSEIYVAEQIITGTALWSFFVKCCDVVSPFHHDDPFLVVNQYLKDIAEADIRNILVHGVKVAGVAGDRALKNANTIIMVLINHSAKVFRAAKVDTANGKIVFLGDPLEDLRRRARKSWRKPEEFGKSGFKSQPVIIPPKSSSRTKRALDIIGPNTLMVDLELPTYWTEPPIIRDPKIIKAGFRNTSRD